MLNLYCIICIDGWMDVHPPRQTKMVKSNDLDDLGYHHLGNIQMGLSENVGYIPNEIAI